MHCRWSRIRCLSPRFRRAQRANKPSALRDWARTQITLVASVGYANRGSLGDADVFVGGAVVEAEGLARRFKICLPLNGPLLEWEHTFHKDNVGNLADLLPFFFGDEDGGVGTGEEPAGIVAVEDGDAGAIDELVVGTIVDVDDPLGREKWRGTGLDDARVKHSGAAGKDRSVRRFGPAN